MNVVWIALSITPIVLAVFAGCGFMLWMGSRIYYQGTLMANPHVIVSKTFEDEPAEEEEPPDKFDL